MINQNANNMIPSPQPPTEEIFVDDSARMIDELRRFQKKSGIAQERLAHLIGVNLGTVNRWFNKKTHRLNGATQMAIETFLNAQKKNGRDK